jgi:hypothetical protein
VAVGNFTDFGLPPTQQKQLAACFVISICGSRLRWEKLSTKQVVWFGFCFFTAEAGCKSRTKQSLEPKLNFIPKLSKQPFQFSNLFIRLNLVLCPTCHAMLARIVNIQSAVVYKKILNLTIIKV